MDAVPGAPAGAPRHGPRATVYRAIMVAPPTGYAKQQATHVARYDVVVLLETTSPEVLGEVQATQPCKLLVEAVTEAATDVHVMTARCPKRVGDVDKTRQGLFLFNSATMRAVHDKSQPYDVAFRALVARDVGGLLVADGV
jgi:hypothetical protein